MELAPKIAPFPALKVHKSPFFLVEDLCIPTNIDTDGKVYLGKGERHFGQIRPFMKFLGK